MSSVLLLEYQMIPFLFPFFQNYGSHNFPTTFSMMVPESWRREYGIDVAFVVKNSTNTYSLHFDQLTLLSHKMDYLL